MITFNNWVISNSGLIAYQFDNLSAYLEITGDIPTGWTWNLYLQSGANLNIVSLTETENGIGIELTAEMLALSGYYYIQLQGTQGDVVKHTNIIQVYIPRSLSGNVQWPTVPSEFTQVEQRIQTLNSNPPYPGDDGYWMIYDIDSGAYIQSALPLPPSATIQVGTVTDGDTASVTNRGTENAAIFDFVLPRGPQGIPGQNGADGAPGAPGKDGLGVPEPSLADSGKVPAVTADGTGYELVPMSGGKSNWTLLKQIKLSEIVRTVLIDEDESGLPFEVSELLVRAWLTCGESARKNANIGVNGSAQNLAVNLPIVKNTGYFGPCEVHIFENCGLYDTEVVYTDATSPNDPPELNPQMRASRATSLLTYPSVPYEKITGFGIMCTDASVSFSENCLLQLYGR